MARVVTRTLSIKVAKQPVRAVGVQFRWPLSDGEFEMLLSELQRRRHELVDGFVPVAPPQPGSSADYVAKRARLDL